jgi:Cd2+/Zn2+-exporting ATPase
LAQSAEDLCPQSGQSIRDASEVAVDPCRSSDHCHDSHDHTSGHCHDDDGCCDGCEDRRTPLPLLVVSGAFALIAMALHFAGVSEQTGLGLGRVVGTAAALASTVAGLIILLPELRESLTRRAIDVNLLMVIAVAGAWLLGEPSEGAMVIFLYCVGEWLEGFAVRRNKESITKLMELTPQTVLVRPSAAATPVEMRPEDVQLGHVVVVRPGARIPLDGTVCTGHAAVDESSITGEGIPVPKNPGDAVYAGSLSVDGAFEYIVTATVENSTLARIVKLVREAQGQRSPYERLINRFARYYTPLVVVLAALIAALPPLLSALTPLALGGFDLWGYRALTLLVISCPCALVIATPVSVVCGLARAARVGILVKGGAFLELGARVKAIAFDKTGTLTHGKPAVTQVVALPAARTLWDTDKPESTILAYAAALERASTHPLAQAVVAAAEAEAKSKSPVFPLATHITEKAGRGITGIVDGVPVAVGSGRLALEDYALGHEVQRDVEAIEAQAATALVVIYDGQPVGIIAVRDIVRAEAARVIDALTGNGMLEHTIILSGDNEVTATAVARETHIGEVHAGLLPQQKMGLIEQLREQYGTVAMVGDGINDAPALALANVGIAMGAAGSDTALEVADVALMANSLDALPQFFTLARKVINTIHANIAFALTVKVLVMVLAILGLVGMWAAIFADVGVLVLVVLFSMTLLRRKL